jgi:hypothetical protein
VAFTSSVTVLVEVDKKKHPKCGHDTKEEENG